MSPFRWSTCMAASEQECFWKKLTHGCSPNVAFSSRMVMKKPDQTEPPATSAKYRLISVLGLRPSARKGDRAELKGATAPV